MPRYASRGLKYGAVVTAFLASPVLANEALKWNETTAQAAIAGGLNPIQQTRTVAMVQGAVYDAVNAIAGGYTPYLGGTPAADPMYSQDAAAATARGGPGTVGYVCGSATLSTGVAFIGIVWAELPA